MNKFRRIEFKNHPILKDLELDFCDRCGDAVNTVIIAGENGTGKSTIIEALYKIASGTIDFEANIEMEINGDIKKFSYYRRNVNGKDYIWITDGEGLNTLPRDGAFYQKYQWGGIFSDVDIIFNSQNISSVTSMNLDAERKSRRSNDNLTNVIKQLFVDIQSLDDSDISLKYRKAKERGEDTNTIIADQRMPRFTNAFGKMFDELEYSHIANVNNHKEIIFKKQGVDIPIDCLSSGEKQIIYRGSFLLKDVNAINGAFVFIDEPEISLHPVWQQKILDYYKGIFTNLDGIQTSQIFIVTHSPFIIHNNMRKDDKVIVLKRNCDGNIEVSDKTEYYKCDSIEAIKDAFNVNRFVETVDREIATVYLEGRTDEKYFNKALEVFEYNQVPFNFKWVGYIDGSGQEANTGKDSLNKAAQFLIAQNYESKSVCLFDCDTNRRPEEKSNVLCKSITFHEESAVMKKGIENALVLDGIDLQPFYSEKIKEGDYGETNTIMQFDKMKFCDTICEMDNGTLRNVFSYLKEEIDSLIDYFK